MPVTWYVNLPATPGKHWGPEIPLKVTRSRATGYNANRTVTWTCDPDNNNLNTVAAAASFTIGDHPNTQRSSTPEDAHTRDFRNRLTLPHYGPESYTVTAQRSDKQNTSLDKQFDIRRKLYYILNYMNDEGEKLYASLQGDLHRIFADVGIELVRVAKQKILNRQLVSWPMIKPLVKTRPAIPEGKRGLVMRLALVNSIGAERDFEVELPLVNGQGGLGAGADTVAHQNGVWKLTIHLPPQQQNVPPHRQLRLPPEPTATVQVSRYYGLTRDIQINRFTDSAARVQHTIRLIDDRTAEITITGNDNQALTDLAEEYASHVADDPYHHALFSQQPKASWPPELHITVSLQPVQPIGGAASGANIALTQDMSMYYPNGTRHQKAAALCRIFAHEIGHAIGMVAPSMTWNGAQQDHDEHYTDDNGGKGPHCHHNATLQKNDFNTAGEFHSPGNPNCRQVYVPDNGQICIMFHQRTDHHHALEFCNRCQEFMRAQDLCTANLDQIKSWSQVY